MLYSCSVRVDNFPWIGSCPVWSTTASDTVHRVRVEICHVNPLILVYACVPPSLNPSPFPLTDWSSLLEAQLILLFFIIILVCVCVCKDAASNRRAGRLHSSRGRLGLGSGSRGLYQHWLLLCLPQIHYGVLQRDRGDFRCHQQPSVMDLINHAGCHVCGRSVLFYYFHFCPAWYLKSPCQLFNSFKFIFDHQNGTF